MTRGPKVRNIMVSGLFTHPLLFIMPTLCFRETSSVHFTTIMVNNSTFLQLNKYFIPDQGSLFF